MPDVVDEPVKIRVTVTAEVTDREALNAAAYAALDALAGLPDADSEAIAALRADIPEAPAAAIVALVDPESPLSALPGVELVEVEVEVGTTFDVEPEADEIP